MNNLIEATSVATTASCTCYGCYGCQGCNGCYGYSANDNPSMGGAF